MPVWTQGDKFAPTAVDEVPEQEVQEEAKPPKKRLPGKMTPLMLTIVAIVAVVVVAAILVAWQKFADGKMMNNTDIGWVDPAPNQNPDDFLSQFDTVFTYTAEEKASLRAWGYTGDEIETAQFAETPAQELIDASKQAQEEARAALSNPESPEYLALLNQTWLGEAVSAEPNFIVNETQYSTETVTLNADFEKVPTHGSNLFLKVKLEDGSHHWMECSPFRWGDLPQLGNIVVSYDRITFDGQVYITNMREIEVR